MVTFIETKLFSRQVQEYLTDDEYAAVQARLSARPTSGNLMVGTGGVRKLRVAGRDRGKRGGFRLVYYASENEGVIWMLTMYPKSETDSIPTHVLRAIREEIDHDRT